LKPSCPCRPDCGYAQRGRPNPFHAGRGRRSLSHRCQPQHASRLYLAFLIADSEYRIAISHHSCAGEEQPAHPFLADLDKSKIGIAMGTIEITNLTHQYLDTNGHLITAIKNISLSARDGRFISIVGPSGCGKTTLLNIVGGFITATSGSVLIDGKPVSGPGPDRGVVFQSYALFDWLTVRQNIELGLRMAGIKARERADRANRFLGMVGLRKFANRYPYELSGGMKQRVAIARSLANSPKILLMDEPFASLDAQTRELMQEELLKIWETTRKTILFITHSVDEAVYLSSEVAVMSYRPGRLLRMFPVSLPYPRAEYSIRTDPRFLELKVAIHDLVREEITKHVDEDS